MCTVLLYCLCVNVYCTAVLFVCKCVLYCCHRVATKLRLKNIWYHIYHTAKECRGTQNSPTVCRLEMSFNAVWQRCTNWDVVFTAWRLLKATWPSQQILIYSVIHKSLREFRHLRYSSRDGQAEGKCVNRGRDTPTFCPTLQVFDICTLGDAADVNPVPIKFLRQHQTKYSHQKRNKLQRQEIFSFTCPIYNHNWRNISDIYI
jgi:hypothetical protein